MKWNNYVATIKVSQSQIYEIYNDLATSFQSNVFKDLESSKHEMINLKWQASPLHLNTPDLECLVSECGNLSVHVNYSNPIIGIPRLISQDAFSTVVDDVKKMWKGAPYFLHHVFLSLWFI
jgi:hypothetical protein